MTNNKDKPEASTSSKSNLQKPESPLEIKDKVRVLCLHGYRQNANTFKSKLGSFRKYVSKYAHFEFIEAPHIAPPLEPGGQPINEQRSWWANKDDGTFKGTNKGGPAFGYQESLQIVEDAWKNGSFQGLLGFSQGACFVGLICGLSKRKMTCIKPQFAILSSGFISGSLVHKSAYEQTISIPSMHIFGSSDEIIPKEMSLDVAAHFKSVEFIEHNGGHYFPATAQQKQDYIHFFQDRLQDYLENLELQNEANAVYFGNEPSNDVADNCSEEK